jgi:hypothetical protein
MDFQEEMGEMADRVPMVSQGFQAYPERRVILVYLGYRE